jgi:hypothetical protein
MAEANKKDIAELREELLCVYITILMTAGETD